MQKTFQKLAVNRGPLSETLAQDERRGCSRDHEKLDLLLVVPDGHANWLGLELNGVGLETVSVYQVTGING